MGMRRSRFLGEPSFPFYGDSGAGEAGGVVVVTEEANVKKGTHVEL